MSLTKSILLAAGIAVAATGTYFATVSTPENVVQAADTSDVDLSSDAAKLGYTFGAQIASDRIKKSNKPNTKSYSIKIKPQAMLS